MHILMHITACICTHTSVWWDPKTLKERFWDFFWGTFFVRPILKKNFTYQREQHKHSELLDSWGGEGWGASTIKINFTLNRYLAISICIYISVTILYLDQGVSQWVGGTFEFIAECGATRFRLISEMTTSMYIILWSCTTPRITPTCLLSHSGLLWKYLGGRWM